MTHRTDARSCALLIIGLVSLNACHESRVAGPGAAGAQAVPQQSRGLFAAALDHFASGADGRLLVDPRPLRPDADLAEIAAADIATEDVATAGLRAGIARERGLGLTDAADDQRCAFARGLTVPDSIMRRMEADSITRERQECLARGQFTSVIFGLPVPAGAQQPGVWRLKAVRMNTWHYGIWDLYLRPAEGGDWVIVEAKQAFGIAS